MAAATWTDPVDRSDGYVVAQTLWNQYFGDTGNQQFLYENAMIPVAVNTTAQSTTSTSAVDLLTLTPATAIGINNWALVTFECRKQALAANRVSFGLKINSTVVFEATSGTTGLIRTSTTNQAEAGFASFLIPPRSTANYGFAVIPTFAFFTTAGACTASTLTDAAAAGAPAAMTAPPPNAAITSVTIRALNNTSSNAAEVKNAALYQVRSQ